MVTKFGDESQPWPFPNRRTWTRPTQSALRAPEAPLRARPAIQSRPGLPTSFARSLPSSEAFPRPSFCRAEGRELPCLEYIMRLPRGDTGIRFPIPFTSLASRHMSHACHAVVPRLRDEDGSLASQLHEQYVHRNDLIRLRTGSRQVTRITD